jgi:ABC-type lipoprotein release transport system permease subunit
LSPLCLAASVGIVGAAALLACLLPARRAVTLEPMAVLREE